MPLKDVAASALAEWKMAVCIAMLRAVSAARKDIINFGSFTVARMPAKVVSEIRGAKNARISRISATV